MIAAVLSPSTSLPFDRLRIATLRMTLLRSRCIVLILNYGLYPETCFSVTAEALLPKLARM